MNKITLSSKITPTEIAKIVESVDFKNGIIALSCNSYGWMRDHVVPDLFKALSLIKPETEITVLPSIRSGAEIAKMAIDLAQHHLVICTLTVGTAEAVVHRFEDLFADAGLSVDLIAKTEMLVVTLEE